ncbi:hypothetical protein LSTR_LSTR011373 [Laodelphax striatellus]|uniref:PH domain-containing protein n=1 Tax=Laodelphax striatellus TaxID=195883 RepID=A0A482XN56_LAOST|nr:hypothetical protein LSTR_LSTR011373 [Laodelphax striatellus]
MSTRASNQINPERGKLPLTGINVNKLEETENCKNSFEIVGPMIERIVAVCQTREDQQTWIDLLKQQIRAVRGGGGGVPTTPKPQLATNLISANSNGGSGGGDRGFEEDAQILRVIEGYCMSAKSRYTINSDSDSPSVLIAEEEKITVEQSIGDRTALEEKSLVETVNALKEEVKALSVKISSVSDNLQEEILMRTNLQKLIDNYFNDSESKRLHAD